jgi:hypothetical protein
MAIIQERLDDNTVREIVTEPVETKIDIQELKRQSAEFQKYIDENTQRKLEIDQKIAELEALPITKPPIGETR